MARTLTNAGLVLSAYGLLVIHPRTLIAEEELPGLLPHLATMARDQRLHMASPHGTVVKDRDEGADLFIIEACTVCASPALA
jgi:hypothetical protein